MQAERWALIGNAVTVPVAKWLGERLMQPYRYLHPIHLQCLAPVHSTHMTLDYPSLHCVPSRLR